MVDSIGVSWLCVPLCYRLFWCCVLAFWGIGLLTLLGIEMASFKSVGGLFTFYTVFGMIAKSDKGDRGSRRDAFEDVSLFPLSISLIAGPGYLTRVVLLFSQVHSRQGVCCPS